MKVFQKIEDELNNNPIYVQTKALKDILHNDPATEILAIRKIPSGAVTIRTVNTSIDSIHALCSIALAHNYTTASNVEQIVSPEEYAQRIAATVLQIIKEGNV